MLGVRESGGHRASAGTVREDERVDSEGRELGPCVSPSPALAPASPRGRDGERTEHWPPKKDTIELEDSCRMNV